MSENYIVINGKKAELTEEQLEKLGIKVENLEKKYPAKFKVGDLVKVIRSTKTYGRAEEYEDKIFTINHVYSLSDYQYGPGHHEQHPIRAYGCGCTFVIYENELELAPSKNLFKREYDDVYHYVDENGEVHVESECYNDVNNCHYNIGNYCKDEGIMKQRALHEILDRLLWRASLIAGEMDNPWDGQSSHYRICVDVENGSFGPDCNFYWLTPGACYFPTEDSVKDAIENIVKPFMKAHPDFVW